MITNRGLAQSAESATLTWIVTVPSTTPSDASLWMAGNAAELGPWQPNAFRLERRDATHFQGSLRLPIGTPLEYKFTRGSWASVEKSADGGDVPNRTLKVLGDATIEATVAAWSVAATPRPNTGTGDLRWKNFSSRALGGERRVTVWLPPQYRVHPEFRFPVVYFLDGQNVFDAARSAFGSEWKADEAARADSESDSPRPQILVAIDNSPNRMSEYTPTEHELDGRRTGGEADTYLEFLCDELKPWIDANFRTHPESDRTTVVGSSLGGIFVLHAIRTRPDVFGNGIAMSPSLFWGDSAVVQAFESWQSTSISQTKQRLWIDMGTREGRTEEGRSELLHGLSRLEDILRSKHANQIVLHTFIEPDGEHNEAAWARRLPLAFRALFGLD